MEVLPYFSSALLVAFSGAIMPGPLLTVTIGETAKRGWIAAFLLMTGHAVLELSLVIGFFFGLNAVLKNPLVIRSIGVLGGAFLLWMSYGMIIDAYRGRVSLNLNADKESIGFGPILQGIVTSISNPYWTLWWATIGASFVLRALGHGYFALGSFYVGHIMGDFIWYGFIAFIVVSGRQFVTDRIYRGIIFVCGAFLALLALTFIIDIPLF